MKHIVAKSLAVIALACSLATTARAESFAKRVDIGGGRMMYIECHGSGSPTVVLMSGADAASDSWHAADQKGPTVYDDIQKTTRVCAYDRPGVLYREQTFRSDPVPQPTSAQDGVNDLVALLKAADVPGPYVLVAHSLSGTIARVFAGEHPDEVKGVVFVDATSPEFRAQMTPEQWKAVKRWSDEALAKDLAAYPDLERWEYDKNMDQTAAAAALRPMPVVVLSASDKYVDVLQKEKQAGELPPDTPPNLGVVMDRAWSAAQNKLAALVPGAVHITDTHSGHFIMIDNAPVVIHAIRMVVDAVRAGQTSLAEATSSENSIEQRIEALVPSLEEYISTNMKSFDVPGLAIGIVSGNNLVYAKGFGVRSKGGAAVDTRTLFQIGSATKAFLSTTLAIAVDRGKLHWDDRIVDLDPDFQMRDPWVTREFRVFDLMAQRSGLPPYANDVLGFLGLDRSAQIRSWRYVEPVSSFRTTFAYTNITQVLAGRIVARAEGAADWNAVLQSEILDPLGMRGTTYSAAAITASANHALGHRYTVDRSVEVPFEQLSPYDMDGAGDINSNIEDMAKWVSLQLAGGTTPGGQRIVSAENLAYTHTPKVAMSDKALYALGWVVQQTPNGDIVWHSGETFGFGAMVALQLERKLGVIVLFNQSNIGMPDALGLWTLDRLLGNPMVDYEATVLAKAKATYTDDVKLAARPTDPQPSPPLAPLAGNFDNPSFGKAALRMDGGTAALEIAASGAKLRLDPWNGGVYTATLVPEGKFAAMAANLGPLPIAFAQFQNDENGKPTTLRLTLTGEFGAQAYDFKRE